MVKCSRLIDCNSLKSSECCNNPHEALANIFAYQFTSFTPPEHCAISNSIFEGQNRVNNYIHMHEDISYLNEIFCHCRFSSSLCHYRYWWHSDHLTCVYCWKGQVLTHSQYAQCPMMTHVQRMERLLPITTYIQNTGQGMN